MSAAARKARRDARRSTPNRGSAVSRGVDGYFEDLTPGKAARDLGSALVQMLPSADLVDAQQNYQSAAGNLMEGDYLAAARDAGWGALSNMGLSEVSKPLSAIFVPAAVMRPQQKVDEAVERLQAPDADPGQVWRDTGVFVGPDGVPRAEVGRMLEPKFKEGATDIPAGETVPLSEVFTHQAMDVVPEAVADATFRWDVENPRYNGMFVPDTNRLHINPNIADKRSTGEHELQHLFDNYFGLESGSNPRVANRLRALALTRHEQRYLENHPSLDRLTDQAKDERLYFFDKYGRLTPPRDRLDAADRERLNRYDMLLDEIERHPAAMGLNEIIEAQHTHLPPFEAYQRNLGERMARAAQERVTMMNRRRRETVPEIPSALKETWYQPLSGDRLRGSVPSASSRLPPPENARKTQIVGTLPTYRKADAALRAAGVEGPRIDYGAGLGIGARELGYDSFEPFPRPDFQPTFKDPRDIPDDAYAGLTNLNVLNVVPPEMRDEIVANIGRIIRPGGAGVVTTRGRDVMDAKGVPGNEPMSIVTDSGTYQKGFTQRELATYLDGLLGDRFAIEPLKLGKAGALIRRTR